MTVLIAAHNDAPFLGAAIDSVLAQTFTDFDIVVVDDASTDGTPDVVTRYRDPRVRCLVNETNLGAGAARNRGLAAAAGEYVANLDGNDVALPQRLEKEVADLDAHPEAAVVGAQAVLIDVRGRKIGTHWRPTTERGIRWCRIWQNPVIHSAAMFRRRIVWDELGGYEERYRYGEDFDLMQRIAKRYAIRNLDEALVAYRVHPSSMTVSGRDDYHDRKASAIAENLREALRWDDVPLRPIEQWLAIEDVRSVVDFLERCAARFASIHGEDEDVRRHQTEMLFRLLQRRPSPWLWAKIWRRHRPTALRALVRAAARARRGPPPGRA